MKVVNLGYYNKGDQAIVNLCSSDSDPDFGDVAIVQENIDNLAYYYDNAKKNNVLVEKISSSKLRLSLPDNYRQYEGIVTTIPYDVSWRIICNDNSIKPELVYDAMMYIPISEITDDEIILKYVPKGLIPGAILSILSVIAIVILYICDRKRKKCTE